MSFEFEGQKLIAEIADLPSKEQRRLFFRAGVRAYKDWRTWLGLLTWILWMKASKNFNGILCLAAFFAGFFICYWLQSIAIRKQIRILLSASRS